MTRLSALLPLLMVLGLPLSAETRIEIFDYPLHPHDRAAGEVATADSGGGLASPVLGGRSNEPVDGFWFIPRYQVDTASFGDTTLWAVRNEGGTAVDLTVQYFDVFFATQRTDMFTVGVDGVKTVNIRDVPGLPVDPDGFARGFVRINPTGPVSVDMLQVDTSDNFAQGSVAWVTGDFCADWQGRFLSFGPGQGSVFSFLVNGPQGGGSMDAPSIVGDVYDENGAFINSFTIRTDAWIFSVPILDLVLGGVDFGSVELTIDSRFSPPGLFMISHSADGRFSVGLRGICRDTP